ncbi:MAG: DUF2079 domain-containing protein, partial [Planctomycetia bacterium]
LAALLCVERRRHGWAVFWVGLTLLAKEEYALVAAGLGLYTATRELREGRPRRALLGVAAAVAALLYLVWVLTVFLPYFRAGGGPHYTPYFASWGGSPREIVFTALTNPGRVVERLATLKNLAFVLAMLAPAALTPLAAPFRLLVAAPIFGYLMLGDLPSLADPRFHFHGPLVPLVWWAAVGGSANLAQQWKSPQRSAATLGRLIVCLAVLSAGWFGRGPTSWRFHDPLEAVPPRWDGRRYTFEPRGDYWRDVYLPAERSRRFAAALAVLSPADRVAATDYVRGRLTHFRAAHDYPVFRKHVGVDDLDAVLLDKTEGWWGRGPNNLDREMLAAMDDGREVGGRVRFRDRWFTVVHHDEFFFVLRRMDDDSASFEK